MDKLNESLKAYYLYLPKYYDQWNNLKQNGLKVVKTLYKQAEQYQLIKRVELDPSMGDNSTSVEEKLLFNIRMNLEHEMKSLSDLRCSMEESAFKLDRLLDKVHETIQYMSLQDIRDNSVRDNQLVHEGLVAFRSFQASLIRFNVAFRLVDYDKEDSIKRLEIALLDEDFPENEVKRIMELGKVFIEST